MNNKITHKRINLTAFSIWLLFVAHVLVANEPEATFANPGTVATIGIPDFDNRTRGSATSASGSFAPGDWTLPERASSIAADELLRVLAETKKFKLLGRDKYSIEQREEERGYAMLRADPSALIAISKDLHASFLALGALESFRIDVTEGSAYGVSMKRAVTRVSMNVRFISVANGQVVGAVNPVSTVTMLIPAKVNSSSVYDWETVLREAIRESKDDILREAFLLAPGSDPSANTVNVAIKSSPEGADVLVNDLFVGNTPLEISLKKETQSVSIELQGYHPWKRNLIPNEGLVVNPILMKIPPVDIAKNKQEVAGEEGAAGK